MIERHTLKNGLRVMEQRQKNTFACSVLVMVKTGSRNETEQIHGISHFLEHMSFKGTKKRPSFQVITREVDSLGALHNAFTGKEYTGYYLKADNEHFEQSLDILSDIAFHSKLEEAEISKEKGTIIEEINMYEDDPSTLVYLLFDTLLYKNQLVAQDALGRKESVQAMSHDAMSAYRNRYYKSDNVIVSCVGNLPQNYLKLINKYFGDIEVGGEKYLPAKENEMYERRVILREKDTEQSHIALGIESFDIYHKERYAADILSVILGGNASSRLMTEIREKRGLAYFVASMVDRGSDNGAFLVKADLNLKGTEEGIKIILNEMQKMKQEITEEDLKRAKDYIKGSLALSEENSLVVSEKNALEDILGAKALSLSERIKKYEAVNLSDVEKMAREILIPSKMKLAIIGPFKTPEKFAKILES